MKVHFQVCRTCRSAATHCLPIQEAEHQLISNRQTAMHQLISNRQTAMHQLIRWMKSDCNYLTGFKYTYFIKLNYTLFYFIHFVYTLLCDTELSIHRKNLKMVVPLMFFFTLILGAFEKDAAKIVENSGCIRNGPTLHHTQLSTHATHNCKLQMLINSNGQVRLAQWLSTHNLRNRICLLRMKVLLFDS